MLTTALITYMATGGRKSGETRAGAIRRKATADTGAVIMALLIGIVALLRFIGACTIFARSNPKLRSLWLGLVFVLFFIGFSDLYLLYFSLRWGVVGVRGLLGAKVVDYASLPYPRGSALSQKRA